MGGVNKVVWVYILENGEGDVCQWRDHPCVCNTKSKISYAGGVQVAMYSR